MVVVPRVTFRVNGFKFRLINLINFIVTNMRTAGTDARIDFVPIFRVNDTGSVSIKKTGL